MQKRERIRQPQCKVRYRIVPGSCIECTALRGVTGMQEMQELQGNSRNTGMPECGTLRECAGHCGKVRDTAGSGGTAEITGIAGYCKEMVGRRNHVFRVIDCYHKIGGMSTARERGELKRSVFQSVDNPLIICMSIPSFCGCSHNEFLVHGFEFPVHATARDYTPAAVQVELPRYSRFLHRFHGLARGYREPT